MNAQLPGLLAALQDADEGRCTQAATALADSPDPAARDALARALADTAAPVRAHAARGLAALGDERGVDGLLASIDLLPDLLHAPGTMATDALIAWGPRALRKLVPLLQAPQVQTRTRAFMVLQALVSIQEGNAAWGALWRAQGSYVAADPDPARRDAAARLWQAWVDMHAPP